MRLEDFDYVLPPQLIAQTPAEPRDTSRLMVLDRITGQVCQDCFFNLTQYLKPTDVLVVNRTKVLPARLFGIKEETGARLEVFLLRPVQTAEPRQGTGLVRQDQDQPKSCWEVLLRPAKRLKAGQKLIFVSQMTGQTAGQTTEQGRGEPHPGTSLSPEVSLMKNPLMKGRLIEILPNGNRIMEFEHTGLFAEVLEKIGRVPLPPYITAELADQERYQTVYAHESGSVAAPTAGLHFTSELLEKVGSLGAEVMEVLLHVGLGTFRPVQTSNILEHDMHSEYYQIDSGTIQRLQQARAENRRIVAVGTTVARALESWGSSDLATGWTNIFIYPGYRFRWVDALITNFHFPRSTLLMLVSALAGREHILAAYEKAIREEYRFYSFGDAMFIV